MVFAVPIVQADCLRACDALETEIRTRTALEASQATTEMELREAQVQAICHIFPAP